MVGLRIGTIVSVAGAALLALARVAPADISTLAFNPTGNPTGDWAPRQFADGSARFVGGPLLPITNRQ